MPEIIKAAAGTFCWVELGTTDVAAAKKFYGGLFGWTIADMPMGGVAYSMATIGDKQVGGLTVLTEQAKKMGAPPNWLSYVAVDDAAAERQEGRRAGRQGALRPDGHRPGPDGRGRRTRRAPCSRVAAGRAVDGHASGGRARLDGLERAHQHQRQTRPCSFYKGVVRLEGRAGARCPG